MKYSNEMKRANNQTRRNAKCTRTKILQLTIKHEVMMLDYSNCLFSTFNIHVTQWSGRTFDAEDKTIRNLLNHSFRATYINFNSYWNIIILCQFAIDWRKHLQCHQDEWTKNSLLIKPNLEKLQYSIHNQMTKCSFQPLEIHYSEISSVGIHSKSS